MSQGQDVVCIACTAYRPELEWLAAQGWPRWPVRYIDSALHMYPGRLSAAIDDAVAEERAAGRRVLVLFGDCGGEVRCRSLDQVEHARCENCAQALVGADVYQRLIGERACCLFHEWAVRWREVLGNIPGLGPELTAELVRESHRKLVYLNTGVAPVPHEHLADCSAYFGLPVEVLDVSLDSMRLLLEQTERAGEEAR